MAMTVGSISKKRQVSPGPMRQASEPAPSPITAARSGAPLRARTASITAAMADLR